MQRRPHRGVATVLLALAGLTAGPLLVLAPAAPALADAEDEWPSEEPQDYPPEPPEIDPGVPAPAPSDPSVPGPPPPVCGTGQPGDGGCSPGSEPRYCEPAYLYPNAPRPLDWWDSCDHYYQEPTEPPAPMLGADFRPILIPGEDYPASRSYPSITWSYCAHGHTACTMVSGPAEANTYRVHHTTGGYEVSEVPEGRVCEYNHGAYCLAVPQPHTNWVATLPAGAWCPLEYMCHHGTRTYMLMPQGYWVYFENPFLSP